MEKIMFVSEMRDPHTKASSTQIMTRNLLYGFKQNCDYLHFVAIIESDCSVENVVDYYKELADKITIINSRLDLVMKSSKYSSVFGMLKASYRARTLYKTDIKSLESYISADTILISHSPSVESAAICAEIKKRHSEVKYIQYWGDPIALSLIYPEQFNMKRLPAFIVEQHLQKRADKIVYGTKTLYDASKTVFKKYSCKMSYVDLGYIFDNSIEESEEHDKIKVGYLGNYYSAIRDVHPLYNAFSKIDNAELLICGNGDRDLKSTDNITVLNRVSQSEINQYERAQDVIVCLLNKSCAQIPGKVFYQTNTNQVILVILDGKLKEEIRDYLASFKRFEFCDNTEEDIIAAVNKITSGQAPVNHDELYRMSPEYVCGKILE